jgi:imidazolonepropionase-like amidohydrolase
MVDRKMALNPTLSFPFGKFSKHRAEFDRDLTAFFAGPVGSAFASLLAEDERSRFADKFKPFDGNANYKGESLEQIEQGYRKMGQFIKTFVDKGGKIMGAPDIGGGPNAGWNTPGISLHFEMQMLQEAGLTPMQILQADTSGAMEAWRKEAEAGSITAGKRADVVVLNRNPLDDVSATRDINTIIKNGEIVDREALTKWKPRFPNGPYLKPRGAS